MIFRVGKVQERRHKTAVIQMSPGSGRRRFVGRGETDFRLSLNERCSETAGALEVDEEARITRETLLPPSMELGGGGLNPPPK